MVRTIVMYEHPVDPDAFDRHYEETHAGLAARIPNLRSFQISRGQVSAGEEKSAYHLVAQLDFDSVEHMQAGLASPQGVAAVEDVPNFATGPVTIVWYEVQDVPMQAPA
jgi:uncharacterized protein (TIGR02118 family)